MTKSALESDLGGDLRLPKLSHLVAARLRGQIISGKLKPGSPLLPEGQLLEMFKVSRPTLREALRVLEAEQLISIGRGMRSGATVLGPNIQKAAEYTSLMLVADGATIYDIQEARRFFEPAIVRSLSGPDLPKATQKLRASLEKIKTALEELRYVDIVKETDQFHEELARASGNKTILHLIGVVHAISSDAHASAIVSTPKNRKSALHTNMEKTLAGYTMLCELIEEGKLEEAATFWERYMEQTLAFLKRSGLGQRKLDAAQALGGYSEA